VLQEQARVADADLAKIYLPAVVL